MATGDSTHGQRPARRSQFVPSRYDLVLAVIPFVLTVGLLTGHLLPVSLEASLAGASLLGTVALADALFFNPPSPRRPREG